MKTALAPLKSSIMRYALSIGMAVAALLLYQALVKLVGGMLPTYITFYPAVMIAGLLAGPWASLLATVTAALLTAYWILPPEGFAVSSLPNVVGQVIFLINGGLISVVIGINRRSEQRAADYAAELAIRDERKKAEEALRESEEMKREILESISDAFLSLDDNLIVNYFSPAAERILNLKAGEVMGRRLFDAFPEARGSIFEENFGQCIRTKKALSFEARFDVAPYDNWFDVRVYPRNNGIAVFFQVITERKQAEEHIRLLNERLEQQVAKLDAVNKELESFSYSVSHDLRAPLRAIDGFSRMLVRELKDKLDEESKNRLDTIRKNALKMNQLIDDVLVFSRLELESLTMTVIDIENLATDAWNELQKNSPTGNMAINIAHPTPCYGDSKMIKRVLTNLLANAIKFTKERQAATIEVGSYEQEDECVYYVKDNGVGFDMRFADKLFRLFQRLHSEADYEGTGAGLSIVKRIIERHGGRVWAEGKVNEGATFYFSLPKDIRQPV